MVFPMHLPGHCCWVNKNETNFLGCAILCLHQNFHTVFQGLQATSPIPNGQPIIEVIGKVMTKQQYDKDNFGQRE